MGQKKSKRPWHQTLFDKFYYEFAFEKMDAARTEKQVDFIEEVLTIGGKGSILDLCCGPGRHAIELARRGYNVIGLDRSRVFLQKAREKGKNRGLTVRFQHGDMRRIPFENQFDAVINMFTSFGYFEKESDNQRVLRGVARALKPGGLFLIDVMNRDFLMKHFRPRSWEEANGWLRLESVRMDWERGRVLSQWVFLKGKQRREIALSLRIYSPHELISQLASAGLHVKAMFGGFDKQPVSADEHRLILLARKSLDRRRNK